MHFRRGHFLDIHKKMRLAAAGTPVMAIGRIATPAEAEAAHRRTARAISSA